MPGNPPNPNIGDLHIDASTLAPCIVDLPPGDLQGLRVEKEGVQEVINEINANQPTWGDKAGITQGDYGDFTALNDNLAKIDSFLGPARKLVEMLEETRASLVDHRERLIHAIAKSVDGRSKTKGGADLLAKYEKTRAYRSLTAEKAVKTRKKNQQAAEAAREAAKANPAPNPPALPIH